MKKMRVLNLLCVGVLLLLLVGCGEKKELWQILEENQYNQYKPRLDNMVEKYGDMFEMDVYGQVTCTNPEYKGWDMHCDNTCDNFAIRLKRDELEQFMKEIAEPIFGECKVYITSGIRSTLDADATIEEFFTYEHPIVDCWIYVPYSEDYKAQGQAFMDAFSEKGYKLALLYVLYMDKEQYEQADRSSIDLANAPENYQIWLDAETDWESVEFSFKWKEPEE